MIALVGYYGCMVEPISTSEKIKDFLLNPTILLPTIYILLNPTILLLTILLNPTIL